MNNQYTKKWLIKADNDLKTARWGLKNKEPVTDNICFHCQQCVEKYLKAFLINNNVKPENIHDIDKLLLKCTTIDKSFEDLKHRIIGLTYYAVECRYPDDFYIPDLEETKEAIQNTEFIKDFVLKKLKI